MSDKGVSITWRNFQAVRPLSKTEKKLNTKQGKSLDPIPIINPVSGTIGKGTLTTILGPSGSGKTTLLNFLSNRLYLLAGLEYEGEVFINGHPRSSVNFNSLAGYVMQDEVLLEYLTVRETLELTAQFKMSAKLVKERVDEVIEKLGLHSCENNLIGGFMQKGISGGEKKRVSIGVELLTDPAIIFLDEPTTGLDSFTSESLIENLRKLAATGITVIATIHQPNVYIFELFEKMMIIGGREILFHGDAKDSLEYFENIGFKCPRFSNPAEYYLELVTRTATNYEKNIKILCDNAVKPEVSIVEEELPPVFKKDFAGFFKELKILIKRTGINMIRNKMMFVYKSISLGVFVLLVLAAYYQACDSTTLNSVNDRAGIIFVLLVFLSFTVANSMNSFARDKILFTREQANKIYSPASFYLSKLLFEIPFNQIFTFIVAFILYLSVGLNLDDPKRIFFFAFDLLLLDWVSRGYSAMLMIALPNLEAANAAIPFVIILQLLFSGLFINFKSIPNYLIWLEYMSMFKYSWSAEMINEFESYGNNEFDGCDAEIHTGKLVLCDPIDFFSIKISKWHNILALSMIGVIVHLLSYLLLNKLAKKYRMT